MPDFLLRALMGGLAFSVMCAPVGCVVVWRRLAYFGNAVSHAALLGLALGLAFEVNLMASVFAVSVASALLLHRLDRSSSLSEDTALGIIAHGALAAGYIALAFLGPVRVDLMAYLFGDILALTWFDVGLACAGAVLTAIVMGFIWRPLVSVAVDEEVAIVEGVDARAVRLVFMTTLALVVAVGLQIVGALLVVSLLIIPPAAARSFARSPEEMAAGAVVVGFASVGIGLQASRLADVPAGPAIVVAACAIFAASLAMGRLRRI